MSYVPLSCVPIANYFLFRLVPKSNNSFSHSTFPTPDVILLVDIPTYEMAAPQAPYPSEEAIPRAVLVRDIAPTATSEDVVNLFSFCGSIENLRLRKVQSSAIHPEPFEAVVIFTEASSYANALEMDKSTIHGHPVSISPVPKGFDISRPPAAQASSQPGFFGGGFSAFGDLFAGVGTVVAAEVEKASKFVDSATDTGVLKAAKDQVVMATQKTCDFATDLDDKWKVRDNIITAAETGKAHATAVASVVATQTINVAQQVDNNLHISENTGKLAVKARENNVVDSGIKAVTGSFQTLMAQTGLQRPSSNDSSAVANPNLGQDSTSPVNSTSPTNPPSL